MVLILQALDLFQKRLMLFFTGKSRDSGKILSDQSKASKDQDPATLERMHKIKAPLGTAVLPKMTTVATEMQAHIHSALAATKHPEEAWQWVRFLSTPFYQTQFCKIGLWLPSQKALMTEAGLKNWITEGVHPKDYVKIATEYLPKYGHILYQPVGWPEAAQIITPVLQKVWVGDATAEQVLAAAVTEANKKLQEAQVKKS